MTPLESLIQQIAGKQPTKEEWSRLYDEHSPGVRAMLYQMGAANDLDDLVQDCWIKIWKGLATFRGDSSARTWIHRIATHAMYDHYRKKGIAPEIGEFEEDRPENSATGSVEEVRPFPAPDAFVTVDVVQSALQSLSVEHRTVLVLAVMEEHSMEEIAEILAVSAGTVKSRLHHAKSNMKTALKKRGITHEFE